MATADELVNRWFIHKWTSKESYARMRPAYSEAEHGPAWELEVITTDGSWECGCYSSWTRDDDQILTAKVKTRAGEIEVEYGTWSDFPDFVMQVVEFGDLEDYCSVERRYAEDEI